MRKQVTIMCTLTVMTMLISGCWMNEKTANKEMPEGKYSDSETYVDSNGTKVTRKVENDVDVNHNTGGRKAVATTKVTKDPKGLFNKTTSESKEMEKDSEY